MNVVWGAPEHVYGASPPPELVDAGGIEKAVADYPAFGITAIAPMFGTVRYRWPKLVEHFVKRDDFTRKLRRYFETVAHRACPVSVLLEIRDATVLRNIVHCESGTERRVLYETYRPNERTDRAPGSPAELAGADRTRFADPDCDYLFIGSIGSFNYGHWLVDDLPRAKAAVFLMNASARPLRIVIPAYGSAIDDVRIESLRAVLRSDVPIDLIAPDQATFFGRVFYVTPVSDHPLSKSPLALDYTAREVLTTIYGGSAAVPDIGGRRIFVDRTMRNGRDLINVDALRARLRELDFHVIDPETMSFADQVRNFSQASVVVGQMGAAMTSTMFSRPTTAVIHLAPHGWEEPFYLDLAAVRGHSYRVLFGSSEQPERPPHFRDFTIDIDALVGAIAAL